MVKSENFDCGIMVSASHNPYCDNGIKIVDSKGHKIPEDVEIAMEEYIDDKFDKVSYAIQEQIGIAKVYYWPR